MSIFLICISIILIGELFILLANLHQKKRQKQDLEEHDRVMQKIHVQHLENLRKLFKEIS
jgi:preprotein translocase subunit YajC